MTLHPDFHEPLDMFLMKKFNPTDDYKCPSCKVDLVAGIFLDDGYDINGDVLYVVEDLLQKLKTSL